MLDIKDYSHAAAIALKLIDLVEKIVTITPKQSDALYDLLVEILNNNAKVQDYLSHN